MMNDAVVAICVIRCFVGVWCVLVTDFTNSALCATIEYIKPQEKRNIDEYKIG